MRQALVVLLFLLLGFQNCSTPIHTSGGSEQSLAEFFDYPYSSAPKFYLNISLLQPAQQITRLSQFTFLGSVAYIPGGAASIAYEVTVKSVQDGRLVCPTQTGTLTAGQSTIQFDCVSAVQFSLAVVTLKATAAGLSESTEKTF